MIIATILLAIALCAVAGFAARQMKDLEENATLIGEQRLQIDHLIRQNERLRRVNSDHETSLDLVLAEIGKVK